jgi:hypothetical protein
LSFADTRTLESIDLGVDPSGLGGLDCGWYPGGSSLPISSRLGLWIDPADQRFQKPNSNNERNIAAPQPALCVSGCPEAMTTQELVDIFSSYNIPITNADSLHFFKSRNSKYLAIVHFESTSDATLGLVLVNNYVYCDS